MGKCICRKPGGSKPTKDGPPIMHRGAIIFSPQLPGAFRGIEPFWMTILHLLWFCTLIVAACLLILGVIPLLRAVLPTVSQILYRISKRPLRPQNIHLELTIPSELTKSAHATEELHGLLRGQMRYRSIFDKLAGRKKLYSLEIVASRDGGIRYLVAVPHEEAEHIQHSLLSFLPGLKIREVPDYLTVLEYTHVGVVELGLRADFALPLKEHKALNDHDPIAYITGYMTKLAPGELMALQFVTSPVQGFSHARIIRRVRKVQYAIARGQLLAPVLFGNMPGIPPALWFIIFPPLWLVIMAVKLLISIPILLFNPEHSDIPILNTDNPNKREPDDPYERELSQTVKAKLDQPLFEVSMRILVATPSEEKITNRAGALVAAFRMFDSPHQAITTQHGLPFLEKKDRPLHRFQARVLTPSILSYGTILSGSELADLYHFPNTELTKTEGLVKSRSRELPVPLSLKRSTTQLDVVIGENQYGGETSPLGMTIEQRQKHTYVIGKTGMGKTTLLTSAIYQDMVSGKGLAVFDPHGDMIRELLEIVPKHRQKDVVVFDPSDRQYPIGLNILAPGVQFEDEEDSHEWITSMVLSVFGKLTDAAYWGPRMEHILRNATLTALQLPNPTLYTIQQLLTDPVLKQFWTKEIASMGDIQLASQVAPLTHRLGHFITTKMSRHILLQAESTINISDIMNEGKILLVNLSKGDIGEDQSFFFGTLLTSLIWMAAYQRTKIPEPKRRDFFLYVDEFQNFATPQFTDITSEGRKFHISLIASHQNIAQVADRSILKIVAGNASTIICLKASPDDEAFILPFMQPEVQEGDIVNLAPHQFFMKTAAEDSEDAFSGTTVPLSVEPSALVKETVLAYSRARYATDRTTVETYLKKLLNPLKPKPTPAAPKPRPAPAKL